MKIIDAHLHLFNPDERSETLARQVGHENSLPYLENLYKSQGVVAGVVMGNQKLSPDAYCFPPFFRYCIAVGSKYQGPKEEAQTIELAEEHLKRSACVGIKIYAGYTLAYVSDARFTPYIKLAEKYDKPVAIHTGMTAGVRGQLKYSHPLTVDEVAGAYPTVQFVLCHFGNPFLCEAAAVMEKNSNVSADLSGLLSHVTAELPFIQVLPLLQIWLGSPSISTTLLSSICAIIPQSVPHMRHVVAKLFLSDIFAVASVCAASVLHPLRKLDVDALSYARGVIFDFFVIQRRGYTVSDAFRLSSAEVALAADLELYVEMDISIRTGEAAHLAPRAPFLLYHNCVSDGVADYRSSRTDRHAPRFLAVEAGHRNDRVFFDVMVHANHGGLALTRLFGVGECACKLAVAAADAL